jgi:hypothetical protein
MLRIGNCEYVIRTRTAMLSRDAAVAWFRGMLSEAAQAGTALAEMAYSGRQHLKLARDSHESATLVLNN